ncbi:MAG: hypothetical protein ACREQ5_10370 [Candidatus Dormibacteria bacterium]
MAVALPDDTQTTFPWRDWLTHLQSASASDEAVNTNQSVGSQLLGGAELAARGLVGATIAPAASILYTGLTGGNATDFNTNKEAITNAIPLNASGQSATNVISTAMEPVGQIARNIVQQLPGTPQQWRMLLSLPISVEGNAGELGGEVATSDAIKNIPVAPSVAPNLTNVVNNPPLDWRDALTDLRPGLSNLTADQKLALQQGARDISNFGQVPVTHNIDQAEHLVESPNGYTNAVERGGDLQITDTQTTAEAQGKGEAIARNIQLADYARDNGLNFVSDVRVSKSAAGVWNKMPQHGFNVEKNPTATLQGNDWVTGDTRPIFRVVQPGQPEQPAYWSTAATISGGTISLDQTKSWALENGIDVDEAAKFLQMSGYKIQ